MCKTEPAYLKLTALFFFSLYISFMALACLRRSLPTVRLRNPTPMGFVDLLVLFYWGFAVADSDADFAVVGSLFGARQSSSRLSSPFTPSSVAASMSRPRLRCSFSRIFANATNVLSPRALASEVVIALSRSHCLTYAGTFHEESLNSCTSRMRSMALRDVSWRSLIAKMHCAG